MKKFTSVLSFNAAELRGVNQVGIGRSGMPIGTPAFGQFKDVMAMGIFGDAHDANKYYESITAQNIVPKPEDFLSVPFRLISATVVGGHSWKATDFSNVGALRASVPKLDRKPIYPNHTPDLYNSLGIITDPYWDDGGMQDGLMIPPGINGMMNLDAKTNPNLVRKVLMGAVFSNSVTVSFNWEPSHSFDNLAEFENSIGTIHKDGRMVTRKVTEVLDYYETSLVWLGADPFAKLLSPDGKLIHVDESAISFSKAPEEDKKKYTNEKIFFLDSAIDKNIISLSKEKFKAIPQLPKQNNNRKNMKRFLLAFITTFGDALNLKLSEDTEDLTPEQEQAFVSALAKLSMKDESATANAERLKLLEAFAKGVQSFDLENSTTAHFDVTKGADGLVLVNKSKLESNLTFAAAGKAQLDDKRKECVRLYSLAVGGKTEEATLELINSSTGKALDGLLTSYGGKVTEEFSATCTKCNSSTHIEMRSSRAEGSENKPEGGNTTEVLSSEDMYRRMSRPGAFL